MLGGWIAAGLGLAFIAHSQETKTGEPRKDDLVHDPFAPNAPGHVAPESKQVQVQVEFVEMSHEALTKLLFLAKPVSSDGTKLREQVQDMVSKNEAKVLETQILVAYSGQKPQSESIHEFIYPTEYAQPQLPCGGAKPEVDLSLGPVPAAFETRNLGATLEIEPTIDDANQLVDLRFSTQLVWHTGNVSWHEGKDKFGNPFRMQMPDFYCLHLNTNFFCVSGQYTLAGVNSPKDDKGEVDMTRKVMVFVKCDLLVVK